MNEGSSKDEISSVFASIISCAMLIEALITYFNQFFVAGDFQWQMVLSMTLGIAIAVFYNVDVTKYFNMSSNIPYVGSVITGILLSRGSNYVYDLLSMVSK